MISPLIKYDHEQNWFVPDPNARKSTSIERNVTIDISTEKDQHMANHVVNGTARPNQKYLLSENYFIRFQIIFFFRSYSNAWHIIHLFGLGNTGPNVIRIGCFII